MNSAMSHEVPEIIGKLPDREWSIVPRCFPVPAGIQRIYVIILGKHVCLPHKIVAVLTVPMQQNQRIALAFLYEMVRDIHSDKSSFIEYKDKSFIRIA